MNHKICSCSNVPGKLVGLCACLVCQGHVVCEVCDGINNSLTSECSGKRLTAEQRHQIISGNLDYYNGQWWKAPNYGAIED